MNQQKATVPESLTCFNNFSTTTDIWTSHTMMSFMSVTVQASMPTTYNAAFLYAIRYRIITPVTF